MGERPLFLLGNASLAPRRWNSPQPLHPVWCGFRARGRDGFTAAGTATARTSGSAGSTAQPTQHLRDSNEERSSLLVLVQGDAPTDVQHIELGR